MLELLATVGRISLISTPEAEVLIGLNSPPVGSPGLRSQRSMWLGPPPIQKMMRLLLFFLQFGRLRPADPCMKLMARDGQGRGPATCLRKCRRFIPSAWRPPVCDDPTLWRAAGSIVSQGAAMSRIIVYFVHRWASEDEMRFVPRKFPISEKRHRRGGFSPLAA